jgi:nucleoid DNA-binding protein
MRKIQLAGRLARQSGVTKAEAADRLDRVVHQIVTKLRKGESANLPGLGHFLPAKAPGEKWIFEFDRSSDGGGHA